MKPGSWLEWAALTDNDQNIARLQRIGPALW